MDYNAHGHPGLGLKDAKETVEKALGHFPREGVPFIALIKMLREQTARAYEAGVQAGGSSSPDVVRDIQESLDWHEKRLVAAHAEMNGMREAFEAAIRILKDNN